MRFEQLLTELSAQFCGLTEEQVDGALEQALRAVGRAIGVDCGAFAEATAAGLIVTHSYASSGARPYPRGSADVALPWLTGELRAGRRVLLERIPDDLPPSALAERTFMTASGMKAGLAIPISIGGSLICALTFSTGRGPRRWPKHVVAQLHRAGEVFANAVARRRAKHQLEQTQMELTHVSRVAALSNLASVIAHELDQPLTAVVANAEAVRHQVRTDDFSGFDTQEALDDIVSAARRISDIIRRERGLLLHSPENFEPVDLNEAVRRVEPFISAHARSCGGELVLDLGVGLPTLRADQIQLQQVVLNLAINGLQAMEDQPAGKRVLVIRTRDLGEEVKLDVQDAGPTAEAAVLERMFEPFFTTKPEGLGMGLAISRSIVNLHRGRMSVTRNTAGGLTVGFLIPR